MATLQRQVEIHGRYWQAVGKPVRKKDTGYFAVRAMMLSLIDEYFNQDEFDDMCFVLGVNLDNLNGDNLRAKIRSLIEYFEQKHEMYKLIDECEQRKPHIEWPTL